MQSQPMITRHWCTRIFSIFLLLLLFAIPCSASTIQVHLNGAPLNLTVSPVIENGTTLVPLRVISENLGATVNYNSKSKQIHITQSAKQITLTLDHKTAVVNNVDSLLTTAPKVIQNTTMVPLRFISEQLNCNVNWEAATQLITIFSKDTPASSLPIATLVIRDYGSVTLELYPDMAPNTVKNFIFLANNGYYDGLIFHRIIADFMLQGGDPLGNGTGGPAYSISGEFASNGFTQNTLTHTKGVISMARSSLPNSASSQFFIMSSDAPHLDGQYAAFGKVTSGLSLIEMLQHVSTDTSNDRPLSNVVIESIRVNTQGIVYDAPTVIMN